MSVAIYLTPLHALPSLPRLPPKGRPEPGQDFGFRQAGVRAPPAHRMAVTKPLEVCTLPQTACP